MLRNNEEATNTTPPQKSRKEKGVMLGANEEQYTHTHQTRTEELPTPSLERWERKRAKEQSMSSGFHNNTQENSNNKIQKERGEHL
jgi:hypothetical protein